jgi:hypothetical protein
MENRSAPRFQKTYTIRYYSKQDANRVEDVSQIINISKTGLMFFSNRHHEENEEVVFQLFLPHLYPSSLVIHGKVLGCQDGLKAKVNKVRVVFVDVSPEVVKELEKIEQINQKKI